MAEQCETGLRMDGVCLLYVKAMVRELMWQHLTLDETIFALSSLTFLKTVRTGDLSKQSLRHEVESIAPGVSKWCRHICRLRWGFATVGSDIGSSLWYPFNDKNWSMRNVAEIDMEQEEVAVLAAWESQPNAVREGRFF